MGGGLHLFQTHEGSAVAAIPASSRLREAILARHVWPVIAIMGSCSGGLTGFAWENIGTWQVVE